MNSQSTLSKVFSSSHDGVWKSQTVKNICRRAFDLAACGVAMTGVTLASPFLAYVIYKLCKETGRGPIFVQERIGQHGKPFNIYKLQTYGAEGVGPFAEWVRSKKLDELPQIFNVIKGDMSWVGPRPHIASEEIAWVRKRWELKPGILGLGKIRGGNDSSHFEEMKADCRYRRKCRGLSLLGFIAFNAYIIARTPQAILAQRHAPTSYEASGASKGICFTSQLAPGSPFPKVS